MPLPPDIQAKVDSLRRALEADCWPEVVQYAGLGGQIISQPRERALHARACLSLTDEELATYARLIKTKR